MSSTNQGPLVPIRPEKPNDAFIAEGIKLVSQQFENVNRDLIEMIFHDCDYNVNKTIERIRSQDYSNDDWKLAKSTNKKKNLPNPTSNKEIVPNGNHSTVLSTTQKTNNEISSNLQSGNSNEEKTNVVESIERNLNENLVELSSKKIPTAKDEEKRICLNPIETTKEISSTCSIHSNRSKRRTNLSIPIEAVRIHRSVPSISSSIDVQFGDILWINSKPVINSIEENSSNDEQQKKQNEEKAKISSNQKLEDSSIPTENSTNVSNFESSSNISAQFTTEESISTSQSPPVSTPQRSNLTSPNSNNNYLFPSNQIQETNNDNNSSIFMSFNPTTNYPSNNVDYSTGHAHWNPTSTLKSNSKQQFVTYPSYSTQGMYSTGNPQQAPYYQAFPVVATQGTVVPLVMPHEHWAHPQFMPPVDMHAYGPAGFHGAYSNIHTYQPAKYPQHAYYDPSQYTNHYGQTRTLDTDQTYFQQSNKEIPTNSKLSVTAAPFYHGGSNSTVYQHSHPETRHGASYNANNSRNNAFHHEQSQRSYPNNSSNINRHLQQ